MFNGYFSVVKAESKDVEPDADEVRKLRGIWHLVPSNSVQTCIPGDIALLPNPMAWGHMYWEVLEIIQPVGKVPWTALPWTALPWTALPWTALRQIQALPWTALPWIALPWTALPWTALP